MASIPVPPILATLVGRIALAVPARARTTFLELLLGAVATKSQARGAVGGATIGAIVGAIIGAIVGAIAFEGALGLVIGIVAIAVAGAVAGGVMSGIANPASKMDKGVQGGGVDK